MKTNPLAVALAARRRKEPSAALPKPKPPSRPGKRQVSVYLPVPVHEHLRRLAFESRRSMHSILMEGLDRVLREHGTSIKDLIGQGREA